MTRVGRYRAASAIALLALAATITSIGHDFTYDDRYVILYNGLLHRLSGLGALWRQPYWPAALGADGYRPVVTTLFTLEWVAGHGAPWVFHAVNIGLAVAVSVAVGWCASAMLSPAAAFAAGALFAVHPVHVEVTGNIVGQSELLVALCSVIAVGLYLRRSSEGVMPARDAGGILLLFGVALFTKEHAVVLPGLLLAAECTVIRRDDWRARARRARPLGLAMLAVALAFALVRGRVLGDLAGFLPFPVFRFLHLGARDRALTMMTEVPRIGRLLLFPVHLSGDYSPRDVAVANGFDVLQLPGLFISVGLVVLAIALRRRSPVASFGILWLLVAYLPVSNLLVPAGFITAERTLFLPSVGVTLLAGAVFEHASRARRSARAPAAVLAVLLVLGTVRSITRQRVWRNNAVFVDQLVRDAPQGYRAHFVRGRYLALVGRYPEMEREYRRALRLFPYDASMTLTMADGYTRAGLFKPAADLFKWTYAVEPNTGEARYEYVYSLARLSRWREARQEAIAGIGLVSPVHVRLMHQAVVAASAALRAADTLSHQPVANRENSANYHPSSVVPIGGAAR